LVVLISASSRPVGHHGPIPTIDPHRRRPHHRLRQPQSVDLDPIGIASPHRPPSHRCRSGRPYPALLNAHRQRRPALSRERRHHQPTRSGLGGSRSWLKQPRREALPSLPLSPTISTSDPLRPTTRRDPVLVGCSRGARTPSENRRSDYSIRRPEMARLITSCWIGDGRLARCLAIVVAGTPSPNECRRPLSGWVSPTGDYSMTTAVP